MATTFFDHQRLSSLGDCIQLLLANTPLGYNNILGGGGSRGAGITEGTAWVRSDKGLFGGPVTAIASLPVKGALVYAGTNEDEIYVSANDGRDWTPPGSASSGHYVAGIEIDPRAGRRIVGKAVYGAGFFLSEDGGQTWKNASRGLGSRSLSCLGAPASSPDTLFAGTRDAGLFVSRNGGRSWSWAGRQTLGNRVMAVDATRDGRTVYAGTQETGLFVSRDGGDTWNAIVLPFGSQPMVTGIDINPADELRLTVTVTGGGTGLSTILSMSGAVNTIAVARDGIVYAGTQTRGAATSRDEGATWQRLNSGLPDIDVRWIIVAGGGVFAMTVHHVVRLQTQ